MNKQGCKRWREQVGDTTHGSNKQRASFSFEAERERETVAFTTQTKEKLLSSLFHANKNSWKGR